MVYSMPCEKAKESVKPCLQKVLQIPNNKPTSACCKALLGINKFAQTIKTRQFMCKCFHEDVGSVPYGKLTGMSEQCQVPIVVPFDPETSCERYS